MTVSKYQVEKYDPRVLRYAKERVAKDELREEGEAKWNVIYQTLKPIAERRGWKCDSITNAFDAAFELSNELEDGRVHELFTISHGLHEDMFADVRPIESIQFQIECANELLHILKRVGAQD